MVYNLSKSSAFNSISQLMSNCFGSASDKCLRPSLQRRTDNKLLVIMVGVGSSETTKTINHGWQLDHIISNVNYENKL